MPTLISGPSTIKPSENKLKTIEEFVGLSNSKTSAVSIARMKSLPGWTEPGQTPEFDEYTVVLSGILKVESKKGCFTVKNGQAIIVHRGEWVKYSTPSDSGAEYISVCTPAFSVETVHRDEQKPGSTG